MTDLLGGRTALVTGASRGIGRAIAVALAAAGAHIIAIARTQGGLEELDDEIKAAGGAATLVPLDLRDGAAIDRLGAAVFGRWKALDILIGNAGVLGTLSPLAHLDPETWNEVLAVNVTANWRLIRSFDPLLRQSSDARALFVTSGAAHHHAAYWGAYSASKAALEALVKTYAAETLSTTVRVNILNPGPLRTRMRAEAMPGEDPQRLPPPEAVAPHILALVGPGQTAHGAIFDFRDGRIAERHPS
ncbi:MAG: SDR family NAD(P)-dependent oxidoreductase [Pseudomonadota bacterium]|nr:SDR family NAD(P)-dependent oxidoreductase [Pseudomonadota bacterium]